MCISISPHWTVRSLMILIALTFMSTNHIADIVCFVHLHHLFDSSQVYELGTIALSPFTVEDKALRD